MRVDFCTVQEYLIARNQFLPVISLKITCSKVNKFILTLPYIYFDIRYKKRFDYLYLSSIYMIYRDVYNKATADFYSERAREFQFI